MSKINVFGQKPRDSIFMPQVPYAVRNDCKVGQWKVGEDDYRGSEIEISIIAVKQMFGTLGQTQNTSWLQVWFVPAPNYSNLPENTVCLTYLKKRSIEQFSQKIIDLMGNGEPAEGIFVGNFDKHQGDLGTYYSVKWDWRKRETEEEEKQLDAIAQFLNMKPQLVDMSVNLIPTEGLSPEEIQALMKAAKSEEIDSQKNSTNGALTVRK